MLDVLALLFSIHLLKDSLLHVRLCEEALLDPLAVWFLLEEISHLGVLVLLLENGEAVVHLHHKVLVNVVELVLLLLLVIQA